MTETYPKSGPTITPEETPIWKASQPVVDVVAGGWVNFDSQNRPAWLWFPIPGQVLQTTPVNLDNGPVSIQTNPDIDVDAKIPYVFFLTNVGEAGEILVGNSPPYIKIKDPHNPPGGTGDNG